MRDAFVPLTRHLLVHRSEREYFGPSKINGNAGEEWGIRQIIKIANC